MKKDLTGLRFGKLVVLEETAERTSNGSIKWLCLCDCGEQKVVASKELLSGHTKSCGCLNHAPKNVKHGLAREKLYSVWNAMMSRCYNNHNKSYKSYGARGIVVCDAWHCPDAFIEWSNRNGYKEGLSIDRIDVNGNYCPENCRWITPLEQMSNKTTNHYIEYNGKSQTLAQWARETGIRRTTLMMRINKRKWSAEKALTTYVKK